MAESAIYSRTYNGLAQRTLPQFSFLFEEIEWCRNVDDRLSDGRPDSQDPMIDSVIQNNTRYHGRLTPKLMSSCSSSFLKVFMLIYLYLLFRAICKPNQQAVFPRFQQSTVNLPNRASLNTIDEYGKVQRRQSRTISGLRVIPIAFTLL